MRWRVCSSPQPFGAVLVTGLLRVSYTLVQNRLLDDEGWVTRY